MNQIETVLRLSDNSTVPIVLRTTPTGWLKAVTVDGKSLRLCKRKHILINSTIYTRPSDGATYCKICNRISTRRSDKKWYAEHREEHKRNGKIRRARRAALDRKTAS